MLMKLLSLRLTKVRTRVLSSAAATSGKNSGSGFGIRGTRDERAAESVHRACLRWDLEILNSRAVVCGIICSFMGLLAI